MLVASVLGAAIFSFPIAGIVGVALSIGFTVMAMIFPPGQNNLRRSARNSDTIQLRRLGIEGGENCPRVVRESITSLPNAE